MTGDKDLQRRLEMIERGVRELETVTDPGLRATVQQLLESILELHGRSLERLLEIVHGSGVDGPAIIDELGRDPIVGHLLLLHSLHPLTLEARVLEAVERVRPSLGAQHAEVDVLGITDGTVRVRLLGGPEQKAAIERAILEAAPDVAAIEIDGSIDTVVGFVSLESVRGGGSHPAPSQLASLALPRGA